MGNIFFDHAEPVLRGEPTITDEQRASLWDAFNSKSPQELTQHLQPLDLSPEFKQKLLDAKKASMPDMTPVETVVFHLNHLKDIDKVSLEAAEQHPNLAAAIIKSAFEKIG